LNGIRQGRSGSGQQIRVHPSGPVLPAMIDIVSKRPLECPGASSPDVIDYGQTCPGLRLMPHRTTAHEVAPAAYR
jgi:hypothetical protein